MGQLATVDTVHLHSRKNGVHPQEANITKPHQAARTYEKYKMEFHL